MAPLALAKTDSPLLDAATEKYEPLPIFVLVHGLQVPFVENGLVVVGSAAKQTLEIRRVDLRADID